MEDIREKIVCPSVVNLSRHNLTTNEISLHSKGLKLVPTPRGITKVILKEELEACGMKFRLIWHFRMMRRV